ncbi:hypothetical protein, partial [Sphaerotilus sp.]|uniref:hypothetical protein n=1 Tax=Sphaerotilus sp. TaxID=2093942 RepID=UPI0034E2E022
LTAGREYEFNRLIRRASDAGKDIEVVFRDGVYADVRLQIIKQGLDTSSIYLLSPGADAAGHTTLVAGKPYHYGSYKQCNQQQLNCRVQPEDFAEGPRASHALILRAEHPRQAVFDGAGFQRDNPDLEDTALVIGGAYAGVVNSGQQEVHSEPIKNVTVSGLVFRHHRNGILVQHGLGITVDNCLVEDIGTHRIKAQDDQVVGVSGFSANSDSQLVLVRDTTILNVWNLQGPTQTSQDWPGLMHSVYNGDSRDIIFLNNTFQGSSGPMLKFGYYPIIRSGQLIYQYPADTWARRGFFIGNQFVLASLTEGGRPQPVYVAQQAFILDNSEKEINGVPTPPAKGMLFINNLFRNALPDTAKSTVAFLRKEMPIKGSQPSFPDFHFAGNRSEGVPTAQWVVHRDRGTAMAVSSNQRDDPIKVNETLIDLLRPTDGPVDPDKVLAALLQGPLRSPDPERDALVSRVIRSGHLPRVR